MTYYDEPLLDRDILNENTMNSEPLQAELFTLFFEQGKLYLTQLEDALRDHDAEAWRMTAHGIKGASRSLGMTRLATVAMEAEKSAPDADNLALIRSAIGETRMSVWPQEDAA
jgi:HPt (histidine-containing phosphotransfer) domain-containing protein